MKTYNTEWSVKKCKTMIVGSIKETTRTFNNKILVKGKPNVVGDNNFVCTLFCKHHRKYIIQRLPVLVFLQCS